MTSGNDPILMEISNGVALLTLNRPDDMNTMTQPLWHALLARLTACSEDDAVRAIVITGQGRAFCAGADKVRLRKWANGEEIDLPTESPRVKLPNGLDLPPGFDDRFSFLTTVPKPIIAAINGPAAGTGFILSLYCDIRFAAEGAKMTTAFARLGLIGEMALPWMLTRTTSPQVASDLLFSARIITGAEAERMGLVNRALPQETLMPFVMDYARQVAATGSVWSQARLKEQIYRGMVQDIEAAVNEYYPLMYESLTSDDYRTRLRAMLAAVEGRGKAQAPE
jgi:enoyl-CoA hydratase/carnithine racemase